MSRVSNASMLVFGLMSLKPIRRRRDLWPPDVFRAVNDLPLQVRFVNHIEIDDAKRPNTRRRKI